MRLLRWLVRARIYSDVGMWYLPAIDMIVPIVLGVIQQNIITAILAYGLIKCIAALLGYIDVHHLKRIQYSNEFGTKLNPYLIGVINGNTGRNRKRNQNEDGALPG